MPLAAIIPAAIGGVTSIIGGIQGASAAKNAAAAQQAAANKAAGLVQDTAATVNPWITQAAANAGSGVSTAAAGAGSDVSKAAALGQIGTMQGLGTSQDTLNPYIAMGQGTAGTLATDLAPGGSLTQTMSASQMEANDPGYAMRIKQGALALQRAQAATGGGGGGGAAKALVDYSQNAASSEYSNAFTRFQQSQQQQYNMLAGTTSLGINPSIASSQQDTQAGEYDASLGMTAAQTGAQLGMTAAEYGGNAEQTAAQETANNTMGAATQAGNYYTQAGNAQAAGDVGSANAWNGMLSGIGKAANTYGTLSTLGQMGAQDVFAPITPYSGPSSWNPSPGVAPPVTYNPGTMPSLPPWLSNPAPAPGWNQ